MKWHKQGLIYVADGHSDWAISHAMIPTPLLISERLLRIYLTFCDANGIGRIGYIEVDPDNPKNILNISTTPVLDIGLPGSFDENGVLQTSIIKLPNGKIFLYYAGFELGKKIRYRLLTGLAISEDNGKTFKRFKHTPVLERSTQELYFRCGAFVLFDEGIFKLWYVGGSEWIKIDGKEMPVYVIKYLESADGIHWGEVGKTCFEINPIHEHGFGRPYVIKKNNHYLMFYSIRVKHEGYRLGYAESPNGKDWIRKDSHIGIDISSNGWDQEMVCYSAIYSSKQKTYMLYNGNNFGQTGVGYAVLEE